MRIENANILSLLSSASLAGNVTGPSILIEHIYGYSFQIVWTGSPVGNFYLEASNDLGSSPTTWDTIGGTTSAAGGAGGTLTYNIERAFYRWVRLRYAVTSGTGTITVCNLMEKGV